MGEVWVAKQSAPVKRQVALKVIKTGMDSKAVLARFEQERQALALMDHPNIARVYDGGLTAAGQPFFVMELIDGQPLDTYCDDAKLTVTERLELFVPICQAIQHAHQKGIVHRDLKPANVLVTRVDGRPVPKVIDFGVAKATSGRLTDESMATQFGSIVGTLEYMAPEQAGLTGDDVDTRADVFSLGVVLYELLTGLRPIDAARLRQAAVTEMIRIIREEEPARPSTRLSTDDARPSLAAVRRTEPGRLAAALRGELDWIVMKCLEKQRDRRYETANGLGRDIERYLADEPVEARPPSTRYRFSKFLKRNKTPVLAATLVLLTLVAGVVGTSLGWIEARRQAELAEERAEGERLAKLDAEARRTEAEAQRERAKRGEDLATKRLEQVRAEKQKAEEERLIAEAVKNFLQRSLLSQADVRFQANCLLLLGGEAADSKPNPTIRELLDRVADGLSEARIEENFPNQPRLQAEILLTVGRTYYRIGEYERAIEFLVRARASSQAELGQEHDETLESMNTLAMAYVSAGKPDMALPLLDETLALMKATLGPDHPDTAIILSNLATAYDAAGKPSRAVTLTEEALRVVKATPDPDDRQLLTIMGNLSMHYGTTGKHDLAVPLSEEVLELLRAAFGPEHPDSVVAVHNLGVTYASAGKVDLALPILEEAVELCRAEIGPNHPRTLLSMLSLANVYSATGQLDRGIRLCEQAFELSKTLGPDHPHTHTIRHYLVLLHLEAGDLDSALPLQVPVSSATTEDTVLSTRFAVLQAWLGRDAGFAATAGRALRFARETDLEDPRIAERTAKLVCLRPVADEDQRVAALELAKSAVAAGEKHVDVDDFRMALGMAEYRNGQYAAAAETLRGVLDEHPRHPHLGGTSGFYRAMALHHLGRKDEAAELAAATAGTMKPLPEDGRKPFAGAADADDVIVWLAHNEARELIGSESLELASLRLRAVESAEKPQNTPLTTKVAALQAWYGRDEEYAATVDRALRFARETDDDDPMIAERTAKVACLRPSGQAAVRTAALDLARSAVNHTGKRAYLPYFRMALGMAEYRNGHHTAADEAFRMVLAKYSAHPHLGATCGFYRAMALYRLDRRDEATELAIATAAKMKPLPEDEHNPLAGKANADDVIVWLAYKEARELIGFDEAPSTAEK